MGAGKPPGCSDPPDPPGRRENSTHRGAVRGRTAPPQHGGLDKQPHPDRINLIKALVMQTACLHNRTQIIARRDGVDYVECLDCRQIFEAEDLEPVPAEEEEE